MLFSSFTSLEHIEIARQCLQCWLPFAALYPIPSYFWTSSYKQQLIAARFSMDVRAFSTPQLAIVLKVLDDYVKRDEARQLLAKRIAWGRWIDNLFLAVGKGAEQANSTQNQTQKSVSFNDVVSIFRNSTRSKRSETEIQTIKRFLVENVTSIPWKELKEEDKYTLANEIDWQPIVGRSIGMISLL